MSGKYLGAREAAAELGVSVATLYSYVSRGFVRSESAAGGRGRRYVAEDVARLRERAERRRNPDGVAAGALDWGTPVMESSISLIEDDHLFYRGRDVVTLSRENTFEEVAALLWVEEMDAAGKLFDGDDGVSDVVRRVGEVTGTTPVEAYQVALTLEASGDFGAYDFGVDAVAKRGARILSLGAAVISGDEGDGISASLARGWGVEPGYGRMLDAALVLCADHELPVSTFAARCVASSRATPYAVVQAGLAALGGTRHGGVVRLVESFVKEVEAAGDARKVVYERLRRGEGIPGFGGHRMYPGGDPRGKELLRRISQEMPGSSGVEFAGETASAVEEIVGDLPTIDFGLVTLERVLELPEEAAFSLFAIGRSAGWVSHAIEQYRDDSLIRPRTKYIGELPEKG